MFLQAILFPWFPSLAVIKRTIAGTRLYMILNNIVSERQKTGNKRDDPLQFLIDQGDDMGRIIEVRHPLSPHYPHS
jgi:hypothetical protein